MPEKQDRASAERERALKLAELQQLAAAVESQLAALSQAAANVEAAIAQTERAMASIEGIMNEARDEVLFPLDSAGEAFGVAKSVEKDRFLVHVGLSYYAEVSGHQAINLLKDKKSRLEARLKEIRDSIAKLTATMERIQQEAAALSGRR